MKSLLTPGLGLLIVAILMHTGLVTPNAALIAFAFYGALIAGLLMAWRFHSSRTFLALLILFLAEQAISYFSSGHVPASGQGRTALTAVGLLLPLNFVLLSFAKEKGFVSSSMAPAGLFIFVQSVVVAVLCRPESESIKAAGRTLRHPLVPAPLPFAAFLAFAAAAVVLLARFALFRKPAESGLLWALAASFLALHFGGSGRIPAAYFAAAAFILAGSIVETSYLLAYHDELTTLPSRRAFHEALLGLAHPYSIAMVDIDHFKRCNDTYGHNTGDQVLRLVASRLAKVTGGGQAYRCGGEEFAIVYAGKTTREILDPLEQLRAAIEASSFRLRGMERRQQPRGPERRSPRSRAGAKTSRATPPASRSDSRPPTEISVTASIGVATSTPETSSAEEVIQDADKALYRAKSAGRNRVETASAGRRRVRTKDASIA